MKVTITFIDGVKDDKLYQTSKIIERAVVISVGSEYLRVETLSEKFHFPVRNILSIKESPDDE